MYCYLRLSAHCACIVASTAPPFVVRKQGLFLSLSHTTSSMAPPTNAPNGLIAPAYVDPTLVNNPLLLHANEPLVNATPFLQWQAYPPASPGGPARVGIPHSRAVKVFLRRCTLDQTQVNGGAFSNVDCFTFFLNTTSWNRILNQMLKSNLLVAGPFTAWLGAL